MQEVRCSWTSCSEQFERKKNPSSLFFLLNNVDCCGSLNQKILEGTTVESRRKVWFFFFFLKKQIKSKEKIWRNRDTAGREKEDSRLSLLSQRVLKFWWRSKHHYLFIFINLTLTSLFSHLLCESMGCLDETVRKSLWFQPFFRALVRFL